MDNKQRLEELEKQKREIEDELRGLEVDVEENPQNEEYINASDEDKREKYPELYAMYQKLEELTTKYDTLVEEMEPLEELVEKEEHEEYINKGKQRYTELEEKIAEHEKEIETKSKEVPIALEEIQALNKEIYALKETEEYKNGDEATLDRVKELESEMESKILDKNKIVASLKDIRTEINKLEEEKAKLVEEYGEEILPVVEQPLTEQPAVPVAEGARDEQEKPEGQQDGTQQEEKSAEEKKPRAKGKGAPVASGVVVAPVAEEQPKQDEKESKTEFKELYAKCKNGNLTDKDFVALAEIMKDPANYDKYGITTGVIFNKSKSILRAMAKVVGDTNTLSKEAREKLGLAVEKPNKDNGLMSKYELMEWKGLKELVNNPDRKIAAEEQFKKVVAMDRNALTDEQKEVWDKAQSHLSKFAALRGALSTYGDVTKQRTRQRWSWLIEFNDEQKPALNEGSKAPTDKGKGLTEQLAGQTKTNPDYSEISPKSPSKDKSEQTK